MYGEHLSNDEEKCIDDILSNGLNEVEQITFNDILNYKNQNDINKNLQINKNINNDYLITNNSNNISYRPKSSALKNLIEQLKKNEEYSFMNNTNKINAEKDNKNKNIKKNNITSYIQKEEKYPEKKNIIKMNINNIEKNNIKYLELKNEMEQVQKQLSEFNNKIKRSISESNKEAFFPKKAFPNKKKLNNKNKLNIDNSISSLNDSYSSNIKRKNYLKKKSPLKKNSAFKEKYLELKSKYELQKEKIISENQNITSLENKIKIISKKNENYNQLVEYNKKLFSQGELLKKQIIESENIRNEQSKLIRSLQKEIEILRIRIDNSEEKNIENLSELYEEMKKSLLKSKK